MRGNVTQQPHVGLMPCISVASKLGSGGGSLLWGGQVTPAGEAILQVWEEKGHRWVTDGVPGTHTKRCVAPPSGVPAVDHAGSPWSGPRSGSARCSPVRVWVLPHNAPGAVYTTSAVPCHARRPPVAGGLSRPDATRPIRRDTGCLCHDQTRWARSPHSATSKTTKGVGG